jgi:AbrB family looped-hinge helix DNA binding protein
MACAIINGMNVKIDKAGRIVLPKPVRERFRLRQGSDLEIEERPEGLLLKPVDRRPSMVQKNGIWVHLGKLPKGFDWDTLVEDARDDRIKELSGL